MNPKEFSAFEQTKKEEIARLKKEIEKERSIAEKCKPPKKRDLRPATKKDMVEGAVFWSPKWNSRGWYWTIVDEIFDAGSYYYELSIYELVDAWVEITP